MSKKNHNIKSQENKNSSIDIFTLIKKLSEGLYEKEEAISLTLLCALAGKSVFLYGPPGTAKSLIVRRIASAFKDSKYFGQLMNRFTTPEDVFGPVSLSKLKEDKFERQTEGYLPKADFVFLDEIWKSSPAILNTLLTIINEKVYRNGSQEEKVPLKALVSASNETPPKGQGLEAMYDRFIMRLFVDTAKDVDNFVKLISDKDVSFDADLKEEEKISTEDWLKFHKDIDDVSVSDEALDIICSIKYEIDEYNKGNNEAIYISDRRWKNIVYILKAAAFFSERNTVMPVDCFLITHCIWTLEENIDAVKKIVLEAIKFFSASDIDIFDEKIEDIKNKSKNSQNSISTNSSNNNDLEFETVSIKGKKFVKLPYTYQEYSSLSVLRNAYATPNGGNLYVPLDRLNSNNNSNFNPYNENGEEISSIQCNYLGNFALKIKNNVKNDTKNDIQNLVFSIYGLSNFIILKDENGKEVSETTCSLPVKNSVNNTANNTVSVNNSNLKIECNDLINNIDDYINSYENYLKNNINHIYSVFLSDENNRLMAEIYNENISELKSKVIELEKIRESLK
ncbi:AAA family ATPase [uncultured Brachyspira sp.]|uniref:AAA family ATPase n=1 Tax=uncultured Brachyspira sp. TaxID=221953 RepID=UPI002622C554|nr:AAA family ATPase [uncultured Brachyspira sp.]